MNKMNLPAFEHKLVKKGNVLYILDIVRKSYVRLTPEEWVRQHFINYLIAHLNYPKSRIKVEGGFLIGSLQKRADIVVFNKDGRAQMVIECKASYVKLSDKVIQQISFYHSKLLPELLVITNGLKSKVIHTDPTPRYIDNIPHFQL